MLSVLRRSFWGRIDSIRTLDSLNRGTTNMRFSTVLLMTYVRGFVVETNGFSVLSPAYLRRHQLVLPRALMTRASAIQTAAPQRVAAAPSDTSLPFKKHASLPLTEKVEVNVYVDNFIVDSLQLKKNQRKGSFLCTLDSLQDAKSIRSVINTRRPFLVDKTYNFFLNVPGTQLRPLKLERAASEVVSRLESAPRKVLQVFVEPKPQQVLTSGDMARPELAHMPDPSDTESYSMVSFFKFTDISDPDAAIQSLFELWRPFKALGRVYVAKEGVNAQMAVASNVLRYFKKSLMQSPYLLGVFCNVDRELSADDFERLLPFHSLHIRRRHQVLADGGALAHLRLDIGTGQEMNPLEWHSKLDQPEAIVLDCRNKFESEVGRFDRAIPLNTTTFRESWGVLSSLLKGRSKDTPIMTYCTGGIRCVKVNAFIEQELGFKNVSRLKGGIINYVQQLRKLDESINKKGDRTENASSPTDSEGIVPNSKFRGMNYVFDERVCARITDDVMALCESCGTPWDMYANCNNAACDKRFIQCPKCYPKLHGCCSAPCQRTYEDFLRDVSVASPLGGTMLAPKGTPSSADTSTAASIALVDPVAAPWDQRLSLRGRGAPKAAREEVAKGAGLSQERTNGDAASDDSCRYPASKKMSFQMWRRTQANSYRILNSHVPSSTRSEAPSTGTRLFSTSSSTASSSSGNIDLYCERHSSPEPALLRELRRETLLTFPGAPEMSCGGLVGRALSLLSKLTRPRRVLEIGTFTGYSALSLYEGVTGTGSQPRLVTIEKDFRAADIARRYFKAAGADIDLRLGAAESVLDELRAEMFASDASSGAASDVLFDLVFLDADKRMYETYLGLLLSAPSMLRPGALIVVDNTLWKQTVVQYDDQNDYPSDTSAPSTVSAKKAAKGKDVHAFNQLIARHPDLSAVAMLPVRDGLTLALYDPPRLQ